MNKHGQTLIIFVILVPIIITMLAVIVDVGLMINSKNKASHVLDESMKIAYKKKNEGVIKEILEKNEIDSNDLTVKMTDKEIVVNLNYQIKSIFGNIIRIEHYDIKINKTLSLVDGQIKIVDE